MSVSTGRRTLLGAGLALGLGALSRARAQDTTADPTQAQPKLPTQALTITTADGKTHDFSVELARTPREQQVGLMYRTEIDANGGMLFVWPRPQVSQMWMEHCPVGEDMVFIGADGRIVSIAENTVPQSLAIVSSGTVVTATLELQGGVTEKLGISVGDKVASKALPVS
jgi:uncharacterized membrane protein (UPF0127 family)